MSRNGLLTTPNAISLSRFVLAGLFVIAHQPTVRLVLLVVASASDYLDGWLARRRHTTTRLGALIDPIADRAFVVTAVCTLLLEGALTIGACLVLLARDLATALGFFVARSVPWLRDVTFRARWLGKVVTGMQLLTLLSAIIAPALVPTLVVIVGVLSAASIADYTLMLWRERAT